MKKDSLYKTKSLPEVQHFKTNLEVLNKVSQAQYTSKVRNQFPKDF